MPDSGPGSPLPRRLPVRPTPRMYVCHCNVVTDQDILESIANGARCVADVARETGAGRTCGGCVESLRELVCQHCPVMTERQLGAAGATR